jgi:hypothetical protein
MTVLQHYYTSFVNKETGVGGFQVQAMSPGLSQELQAVILRLISYRLPSPLEQPGSQDPPVALRYYYHSARESILLCCQACGADENGRPGNYFAHSAVLPPETFITDPPFLYWHSSFWRKESAGTAPIRPLPSFPAEQNFELLDKVWTFLAEEGRAATFVKLMSAVIESGRTNRRIVIIDSDEQVILWVAALTMMLPPSYRPHLSFATYHHDPEQSWFLITGVSEDMLSRFSVDESFSHFVLRGRTNQCSQVRLSSYARLISPALHPESYETYLLAAFANYERFFPASISGDARNCFARLDLFADYVQFRTLAENTTPGRKTLDAINGALDAFEQMPAYQDVDKSELDYLEKKLSLARARMPELDQYLLQTYQRISLLFDERHGLAERREEILRKDLYFYSIQLLSDSPHVPYESALERLQALLSQYGERAFKKVVNEPHFYELCMERTAEAESSFTAYRFVWARFGPYLEPYAELGPFFKQSVLFWWRLRQDALTKGRSKDLLRLMRIALEGREGEWLQLLAGADVARSPEIYCYFYWKIVAHLPLDERTPYRHVLEQVIPDIWERELGYDLRSSDLASRVPRLKAWVSYAGRQRNDDPARFLQQAVDFVQQWCEPTQWYRFALDLLLEEDLEPLLGSWKEQLVLTVFANSSFDTFRREQVRLYRRYAPSAFLPEHTRAVLTGMLAMAGEPLSDESLYQLWRYVDHLNQHEYAQAVSAFLPPFLQADQAHAFHMRTVNALFRPASAELFWTAYWEALWGMLSRLTAVELDRVMRVLNLWFSVSPEGFQAPWSVQSFFLSLPGHLGAWQTRAGYREIVSNLESRAGLYPWYPLIRELLSQSRGSLLAAGQEWMKSMWKQWSKSRDETTKENAQAILAPLFAKGELAKGHQADLLELYQKMTPEQFWTLYQEQLLHLLLDEDVHLLLDLLHFWFVEAGNSLAAVDKSSYLVQKFFMAFAQAVEMAYKTDEARFTRNAHVICVVWEKQAMQSTHSWYPLLQQFLARYLSEGQAQKISKKRK